MSMLTVKLEGVGEGIFVELADNMMRWNGWLSCFWFALCFYVSSCSVLASCDTFLLSHQHVLGQQAPMCHPWLSNLSNG